MLAAVVVPMLVQLLAVLGGAVVVRAVLARAGVGLDLPQATAIALLAFLAVLGVFNLRENWKLHDEQRAEYAQQTPATARRACTGVGVEVGFLEFVANQVPRGERFFLDAPGLAGTGDRCVRMVLLPRLQVNDPGSARYLVFWGRLRPELIDPVKRAGGTVAEYDDLHLVVRVP